MGFMKLEEEEIQEEFTIDNDVKAEWALKKIQEETVEAQRYINVCDSMILDYKSKAESTKQKLANQTSYLESKLRQYFETVKHKYSKTQETYDLPSGKLILKNPTKNFVVDEDNLVKWLKENNLDDLVKTKETPNWEGFKKTITVVDNKVVTADGEIVDSITVSETPATFKVKI